MWRNDLSVAWIDFRKAYDMTPHKWLYDMLKTIEAPQQVQKALQKLIPKWKTVIELVGEKGKIGIPITFRRGLFQGDSLSPLLFCLSVAPLSHALRSGGGYRSQFQMEPLTHLMFMDDLKVYEQSPQELEATSQVAENVTGAVGMKLGAKKCAVAHMRAGRIVNGGGVEAGTTHIRELAKSEHYKYLGIEQRMGPRRKKTVERVTKEYLHRVRKTWGSSLNAKGKANAHNVWCMGVLRYFLPLVDWKSSEIRNLDRSTRAILRASKAHKREAAVERLYLPRNEGGRGLQNVRHVWEREVVAGALYLRGSQDRQVQGAMKLERELEEMGGTTQCQEARDVLQKYQVKG